MNVAARAVTHQAMSLSHLALLELALSHSTRPPSPLANQDPPINIFLAFQGGGALGAFEVGVLEHLHEGLNVSEQIRAISGVSFGAINAAVYVANFHDDPIGKLKYLYNQLAIVDSPLYPNYDIFTDTPFQSVLLDSSWAAQALAFGYSPNLQQFRPDWLIWPFWTYVYCNSNLKPLLEELIDTQKLNSVDVPQLTITSVDIESGELRAFTNRDTLGLTISNIMASASFPFMFKPTEIDGKLYWDGGLFDNSPFATLLRSIDDKYFGKTGEMRNRLITVEVFPRGGEAPSTMPHTLQRILEIYLRTKITQQTRDALVESAVLANWLSGFLEKLTDESLITATWVPSVEGLPPLDLRPPLQDFFRVARDGFLTQLSTLPPGQRALMAPLSQPLQTGLDSLTRHIDAERQRLEDQRTRLEDQRTRLEIAQNRLATTELQQQQFVRVQLVRAVVESLEQYFTREARPGTRKTKVAEGQNPTTTCSITREDEFNYKGLSGTSLGAIQEFADLVSKGQPALRDDADAATIRNFVDNLRESKLIKSQVARYTNLELLPIQCPLRKELVSLVDFSSSRLLRLYEEGLRTAREQLRVSQFSLFNPGTGAVDPGTCTCDLQFVSPIYNPDD